MTVAASYSIGTADLDDPRTIVICPDILGVTPAVRALADDLHGATGLPVHAAHLLGSGPFERAREQEAYSRFVDTIGVVELSTRLGLFIDGLDADKIHCVGMSVGATATWLVSASARLSSVHCLYGSRIRDHLDVRPRCPARVIFAEAEPGFDPRTVVTALTGRSNVRAEIRPFRHGFCNSDSPNFVADAYRTVVAEIAEDCRAAGPGRP
ncbi:dienelactone hydrolase family protein [Millisia brevis]|uniref:dienelactone hydrolase family protein n=1 Tax=Millisia brevis TaxID=264148 RepID=UPI000829BA39|nr:dienelactone hydrolase family protein [Millisia brevis]